MSNFLALNALARNREGLHPLLVALLERQDSIAADPKVVSLADHRGDSARQAGPHPGAPGTRSRTLRASAAFPSDRRSRRASVSDEYQK